MAKFYKIVLAFVLFTCISFQTTAQLAPDFTLEDIMGNEHTLSDYLNDGQAVIIDFSTTWCGPCWALHHDLGHLETVYQKYGIEATKELTVFHVESDPDTDINELYGNGSNTQGDWVTGTSYPIFNPPTDDVANDYDVTGFPTTYVVCPDGSFSDIYWTQINVESVMDVVYDCISPTTSDNVEVIGFESSTQTCDMQDYVPIVHLRNKGENDLTDIKLDVLLNGTIIEEFSATVPAVGTYDDFSVSLSPITNFSEGDMLEVVVKEINNTTDQSPIDNMASIEGEGATSYNATSNNLTFTMNYGTYAWQTEWRIYDSSGEVIAQGSGDNSPNPQVVELNNQAEGCYLLEVTDVLADGISGGFLALKMKMASCSFPLEMSLIININIMQRTV